MNERKNQLLQPVANMNTRFRSQAMAGQLENGGGMNGSIIGSTGMRTGGVGGASPSRYKKPSIHDANTLKLKEYQVLNMRHPAGGIIDLQTKDKRGEIQKPEIGGDEKYAGDMYQFEDRFTDIELEKFKQAFVFFDRDGDGTMACDDVCLAMRAMGALATEKEVKNLLKKYDPDHTGTIDVNDFIACMAEVLHKDDSEQEIKNSFSVFDKADNGRLPVNEMRHVLTRIGDPLTQEEATNFLNILDQYGDGYVRMNEIINLFLPQTHKDVYAKSVDGNPGNDRSNMSYGTAGGQGSLKNV